MASRRSYVTEIGKERPRLVEVLDDVAADDPVEFFLEHGNDLPCVAAVDVIDALAGDRGGFRIELDADHAAALPLFQGGAEGCFAAAELEDGFGIRTDARKEIVAA